MPTRAIIQGGGFLPEVHAEFSVRSIPVTVLNTHIDDPNWSESLRQELRQLKICKTDVVVALPSWVEVSLVELGIHIPEPPDYPECL